MIRGGVKCPQLRQALEVFKRMQRKEVEPDIKTFVAVLNACASVGDLEEGKSVHKQIVENGFESDISVSNGLIDMYSKCGSTLVARKVFNRMPSRNIVSWNSMILGYVYCGHGGKALELSRRMQEEGMTPDPVSFVAMLNACALTKALEDGKRVHRQMIEAGFESALFVGSSLVNMYAKCGSIENARRVFNKIPVRSLPTWNAMIMGCATLGEERQALDLLKQMEQDGVKPDPVTFVAWLKACGRLRVLEEGRHCHEQIIQNGYESDMFVSNGLIDMYGRCGSIEEARKVFDKMPRRNVYSWNTMILEYARCGQEKSVLELSEQMQREDDPEVFTGMLNLCAGNGALLEGMSIHEKIMQDHWKKCG